MLQSFQMANMYVTVFSQLVQLFKTQPLLNFLQIGNTFLYCYIVLQNHLCRLAYKIDFKGDNICINRTSVWHCLQSINQNFILLLQYYKRVAQISLIFVDIATGFCPMLLQQVSPYFKKDLLTDSNSKKKKKKINLNKQIK